MEESAPKRRRTSPRLSTDRDEDDNHESTTPPDPPPPQSRIPIPRQRRPSFASPTRSSLARSNPDILRRRSLSPSKTAAQNATRDTPDAPAEGPQTQSQKSRPSLSSQPARPSMNIFEPEPSPSVSMLESPARRVQSSSRTGPSGALASRPRRSSGKPVSRPFPPDEGPEPEVNPFARGGIPRSPPPGAIPQRPPTEPEPEEEPELPPTPTQRGQDDPVVTTPPRGIHDTPSKRKRRTESPAKSSPLKQPPLRPPDFSHKTKEPSKKAVAQMARGPSPSKPVKRPRGKPRKGPSGTHEARQIPVPDPNAELKKTKDELEAEIARLEADLEFATEENERVRRVQSLRSATGLSMPASRQEQLFDVLRRHLVPPEKETQTDTAQEWFDMAMNPTSWLSLASLGQTQPLTSKPQEDHLSALISHHPIQMTAEEELPYLQAFTPFVFSGATHMLPRESEEDPLLRRHTIDIRSAHPAGLFTAKIDMTVDTGKLRIVDLKVPRLDQAAVAEVRPFISKVTSDDCNSHMKRNVSIVAWAMAEWYRVAVERAKMWVLLENELGDTEKLAESVAKIRTRRKKRRRQGEDDSQSQDADGPDDKDGKDILSRGALLPHLGRTTFEIPIPDAVDEESSCLRIQWRIDFDWTGEAQSKVGLMIGMPGRWRHGDERGSLAKASEVFEKLVQENEGPMTAVRTVAALLAGE